MRTALLAVAVVLLLPACQGRSLTGSGTSDPGSGAPGRGGAVNLSPKDLLPVDMYVDAGQGQKNTRWIVGDDVVVEASREYFGPAISIAARQGAVQRSDEARADETV